MKTYGGVEVQLHALAALFQGNEPMYPLDKRLDGSHSWCELGIQ